MRIINMLRLNIESWPYDEMTWSLWNPSIL